MSTNVAEFEAILNAEKVRVEKNSAALRAEVNNIAEEDESGDFEDRAELQIDNTSDQSLLQQLEYELSEIDAALERIRNGTYGVCEKTGHPIPEARLRAFPTARTLIDA